MTSHNGFSHFIENLKLLTMELTKNSSAVFSFSALAHSRGSGRTGTRPYGMPQDEGHTGQSLQMPLNETLGDPKRSAPGVPCIW